MIDSMRVMGEGVCSEGIRLMHSCCRQRVLARAACMSKEAFREKAWARLISFSTGAARWQVMARAYGGASLLRW